MGNRISRFCKFEGTNHQSISVSEDSLNEILDELHLIEYKPIDESVKDEWFKLNNTQLNGVDKKDKKRKKRKKFNVQIPSGKRNF